MSRYFRLIVCFLMCVTALPLHAGDGTAEEVRYAAVLSTASDGAAGPDAESVESIRYLLADPMVGNFVLDDLAVGASGDSEALEEVKKKLGDRGSGAGIAFYYVREKADAATGEGAKAQAGIVEALPGRLRIVVDDSTLPVEGDVKPAVEVKVDEGTEGSALVVFEFSGGAGGKERTAVILLDALRGYADKDRNRKMTLAEMASYFAERTGGALKYELGGLAGTVVVKYRTPAEVSKDIGPDASLELADKYNGQQRWVEALLVLREIRNAKAAEPRYREVSELAQLNLGLESRYIPDSKAENINRDVDAGLDLMGDMLLLTNVHYVSDVDNRALFVGGIKNLQAALANRRVRKELVASADAAAQAEFALFLKETIGNVYAEESLPESDFIMRVKRVMLENDATMKMPKGAVVTEFIYGIPAALDPNTDFIPRTAYKEFQDDTKGHFGGIGVEITLEDKILTVVTPLDGTPAGEAGILPGDRIVSIEGESTDGIDLEEAVNKLRGPIGTKVTIGVVHRGDTTPIEVSLTRANIVIESIKGFAVDQETGQWDHFVDDENKIAYVRLTDFKEGTPADLEKVIEKLVAQGMTALVLDLRFNHGGLLPSGVQVSDFFMSSGTIVTMQGAHQKPVTFKAHYFKTLKPFPLAVLVNEQSASAAEIVAGALQDNKRATLVGARTFGKGTVQTVYELDRGQSALKLTTAKFYTPNGTSIHRDPYSVEGGLKPDVDVPMSDEESASLVEVWHLRGLKKEARQRLLEKEKELAAKNPDYKISDPDSFKDIQLEKALEILKTAPAPAAAPSVAAVP